MFESTPFRISCNLPRPCARSAVNSAGTRRIASASPLRIIASASGMDWGVLAAAGILTIIPGALVIWFVRNYIAKGFALGRV